MVYSGLELQVPREKEKALLGCRQAPNCRVFENMKFST